MSQRCVLKPGTVQAKEDLWGEEWENELGVRLDEVDVGLHCFFAS